MPCYYVTSLAKAILRGVEAEMTGSYELPLAADVIREQGRFNSEGICDYGERSQTLAF